MLPIGDDGFSGGPPPVVTWALILANALAFYLELSAPTEHALQAMLEGWGIVPVEYAAGRDLPPLIPYPYWSTLFTSMFLHGGWGHLLGNMLYLWIFGDNIEKLIGHTRFLLFYLACGLIAGLSHIYFNIYSEMPTIGASGAISGVLGGYIMLFPRNRVHVLVGLGGVATVPAVLALGFWILIQFINGAGSIATTPETASGGGVAYLAHIGGFLAGVVLVYPFASGRRRPAYPRL